ncbi:4'-phosphopantetheinyl transferase family protein [Lysinibacillus xylanilyticus]|uniref:4'-phosphopantetheinyl transferase family protein n=1 Tax=Lysinibacillus xylanilyticus TaxID=582475 RepID=UPI003D07BF12
MELFAVNINSQLSEKRIKFLTHCMFSDREEDVTKYKHLEDQKRTVYGHLLLRYILSKKMNLNMTQIVFSKNKFGKYFLENEHNIHFNLSHSGDWCIGVISDSPIGVDIELMKPINMDVVEYAFHPSEVLQFKQLKNNQQTEYFYKLWTMKESYLKAIGTGFSSWNQNLTEQYIIEHSHFSEQFIFDNKYMISICKLKE